MGIYHIVGILAEEGHSGSTPFSLLTFVVFVEVNGLNLFRTNLKHAAGERAVAL